MNSSMWGSRQRRPTRDRAKQGRVCRATRIAPHRGMHEQFRAFMEGFVNVPPLGLLRVFELELLIGGMTEIIDMND